MFERFGHMMFRGRRWVLAAAAAVLVLAATWGTGVLGAMTSGGFEDPDAESSRALARIESTVGRQDADIVALYRFEGRPVSDPAFRAAVEEHLAGLPAELVVRADTYWSTGGAPSLISRDGEQTYAVLQLDGSTDDELLDAYEEIEPALREGPAGLDVRLAGGATVSSDVTTQISEDIAKAEALSFPLVLVLLVLIFGGLVAASLPLAIAVLAILGSFLVLRVLSLVTDVSIFAVNIVTMLGMGLAIDYALFVVSRFREERAVPGATTESALVRTMATAGRTVAFSGVTVAIALASLTFFPQVFLRSMGVGGMSAVLVAMIGSLTVLPALLAVLGHRVDAGRVPVPRLPWNRRRDRAPAATDGPATGPWGRLAHSVMRRPLIYVLAIVPVLLLAGAPFLRVDFGGVDHTALPKDTESRQVIETMGADFTGGDVTTVDAAVTFEDGTVDEAALSEYVDSLAGLPGVTSATMAGSEDGTALVAVRQTAPGVSEAARDVVEQIRSVPAPEGAEVLVGGRAAELVDLLAGLGSVLPWAGAFVIGVTLLLLFLAFGSIVLPVKAVVINLLSIGASFGAVVWIFQDGHLADTLGFTPNGSIEATTPILMLAMTFGLSMDYEVFLLSRIREQWDATRDNVASVARGLERSGKIITSAALLLVVVIGAFSTSGILFIKMLGVGMVLAILIDATIVRALLVPATMRLLGRWNWYAPGPLARFWDRFGFRESDELVLPGPRTSEPERVAVDA